jgi:hypothetical protein
MALNDVRAVVGFHDLKAKRGGRGGLSDGGLTAVRQSLSTQSFQVGPPPGKAWQFAPAAQEAEMGVFAFNFDANTANVELSLLLEDGVTEIPMGTTAVASSAVEALQLLVQLAYPQQLCVKLSEAHTGRVLFAALATEFDLPKE